MHKFLYLFLVFFIYSFLGYIIECLYCSIINKKIITNRGFLIGPYLPIYGFGSIFILYFLRTYFSSPVILFIVGAVIASTLEFTASYLMEKIFKARWWDYSDKKYNLDGRICLLNTVLFGAAGLVVVYLVNPILLKLLNLFNDKTLDILSIILMIIFLTDLVLSSLIIYSLRKNRRIIKDSTEEISEKVKNIIRKHRVLKKRLLDAFPGINQHNIYKMLKKMVEKK